MNRPPTQKTCTDAHSVSQHMLNRVITFHHVNTRGSRLHIFVSQNSCHPRAMSRSLPHLTGHKHKFSLTCLTYLSDVLSLHTQVLWRTIHIYPAKIHGRVADQHKSPSLTFSVCGYVAHQRRCFSKAAPVQTYRLVMPDEIRAVFDVSAQLRTHVL